MGHAVGGHPDVLAKRRVLIRVDGDPLIGLGHVMRMRELALVLSAKGAEVTILTLANTVGSKILKGTGLSVHEFVRLPDPEVLQAVAAAQRPHLVVIDTLDTTHETIAALRGYGAVVTFDDCAAGLLDADAVINAVVFHWGHYQRADARVELHEGLAYIILSPDVTRRLPSRYAVRTGPQRLLVALGGTDTRGLTPLVVRALDGVPGPLRIRVNLGPGAGAGMEQVIAGLGSRHLVEVMRAAPSLAEEFLSADLVICGGGNMLCELAALGVPAAAVATEEHERLNIAYWRGQGFVEDLGHWMDLDEGRLAASVGRLFADADRRRSMSQAGQARVDGRGLDRCLEILDRLAA